MNRAALQQQLGVALGDGLLADLRLDSRQVCANDVFLAVSERDWQQHLLQAAAKGAALAVVDQAGSGDLPETPCRVVRVPQLRRKLGAIADAYYGQPSRACVVVGITGTNGKTSCSHWLAQAWQQARGTAGVIGTLGCGLVGEAGHHDTGFTTPDVASNHRLLAEMVQRGAGLVAMEVSSHALDQGRVDAVQFDTAVFTNLTRDHLDYHGDMASYAAAKRKLFEREELQWAVINRDDAMGKDLCDRLRGQPVRCLTYGLDDTTTDLGVERFDVTGRGMRARIRTPWGKGELESRFPGGYNLLNTLAVLATLCAHGTDLDDALAAVRQLQAVPGRTQIISESGDDVLVVVDYAHTPDALDKILRALREQSPRRLWCVFGCGGNRDRGKRPQMAAVAAAGADVVVVTTDNPRDENPAAIIADVVAGLAGKTYRVVEDRAAAIAAAISEAGAGDIVLLAGKGHEEYQEVAGQRLPFSDSDEARRALAARRSQAQGVTA